MPAGKLMKIRPSRGGLTKTQKKQVKALARKTVSSMAEKKQFGFNAENQQLIHNKVAYLDNWLECKQGILDPNNQSSRDCRIGDEIILKNINVRFWISTKKDRPNVIYKSYLFWYDSNNTLDDAYCYFTQTNKLLDRVNNENISVIDKKTIFSGPSYATTENEHSQMFTLNQSWKGRKIIYDEGGTVPKKRNLGVMLVAYDAYGTLQADNIASYAYDGVVNFIDL